MLGVLSRESHIPTTLHKPKQNLSRSKRMPLSQEIEVYEQYTGEISDKLVGPCLVKARC